MADRLLILLDGRLVASGAPDDLLESPPTSAVARFLGFDGMLEDGEGVLLTRPPHVVIDPDGPLDARVTTRDPARGWSALGARSRPRQRLRGGGAAGALARRARPPAARGGCPIPAPVNLAQ